MRFRGSTEVETLRTPEPRARCLDIDDLVAMVEGTLSVDRSEHALHHVDRCAECAEVIANLGSLEGPDRCVGRYQIERLLGTGGMGIVYAAFDPELQRRVAIKLVRPDNTGKSLQGLMVKEARTLARVSHPNVIAIHDVGEHDGEVYIATEFIDGVTLADWQVGRSTADIVGAWIQVARGLAAAHAENVVHRDVKPSNALVGRDGRVRIGDFGIAHRSTVDPIDLPTEVVAGTPAYMAPEQKSGRVDARSDQFSTAVGIVEAVTGNRPDAADEITLEPPALASVLTRALAFDPEMRFATMTEFADALARAIAPPPPRSRARVFVGIAAAAVAASAVFALVAVRSATGESCQVEPPDDVWSAPRREALAKLLPGNITPSIDRYVEKWSRAAADACAAKREVRAARRRCLERTAAKLDGMLDGWEAKPPRGALDLHIGLTSLPHVEWCSGPAVLAAGEPAPDQAAAVAAIEAELAELDARTAHSTKAKDLEDGQLLLARARGTMHGPLVRAVRRVLAGMQLARPAVATKIFRESIAEGPDDFSKVVAITDLLGLLGGDRHAEADALAAKARKLIADLGGDPALEAELDYRLGVVLARTERRADALAAFERMRQGNRIAYGDDSASVAMALISLAGEYYARDGITSKHAREAAIAADAIWKSHAIPMPTVLLPTTIEELLDKLKRLRAVSLEIYGSGSEAEFDAELALMDGYVIAEQIDQALAHARRADELGRALDLRSARLVSVRNQIGNLLIDSGRAAEAIAVAREAIETAEKLDLAEGLAFARSVLGHALVETGELEAARKPLQDALRWMTSTNESARSRGHTRFYLAMATRDVAAARVARSELESVFATPDADVAANPVAAPYVRRDTERTIARIDAWITRHK